MELWMKTRENENLARLSCFECIKCLVGDQMCASLLLFVSSGAVGDACELSLSELWWLLVMSVNCHSFCELWQSVSLSRFLQIICLKSWFLFSKVNCLEAADFDPSLLSFALRCRSSSIGKVTSMLCMKTFLLKQAFCWVLKFILGHSSLRKWNRENVRIILILILEKSRARGPSPTYVIVLADIREKAGAYISLPL